MNPASADFPRVVAVFGATGRTGQAVLPLALAQGYHIRALVRNPAAFPDYGPNVTVVAGGVLAPATVARTIEGSHAVLSVFGQVAGSPPRLQTDGTRHIVAAMRQAQLRRIVSLSGGGLPAPQDRPGLADRLIRGAMRVLAAQVLQDAAAHLTVLQASGLDWTVVRAPRLTTRPATGHCRVGWVGVNSGLSLTRGDLAAFLLRELAQGEHLQSLPMVSN